MNDLQQHIRRFLTSEIPAGELECMNQEHGLHLEPGASFLDALAAQAAQMATESRQWAAVVQQLDGIRGSGDG